MFVRVPKSKYPMWINKNDIFTLTFGRIDVIGDKWGVTAYMKRFTQTPFIPVFQSLDKEEVEKAFLSLGTDLGMLQVEALTFMKNQSICKVFINIDAIENVKVLKKNGRWIIEMMAAAVYLAVDGGETEEMAIAKVEELLTTSKKGNRS